MEKSVEVLIGMAGVAMLALAAVALYRWRQQSRVHRVEGWVRDYLVTRYGVLPNDLHINCSDDELWPVLVSFHHRQTGNRHNLRFGCGGPIASFALLAENEENR